MTNRKVFKFGVFPTEDIEKIGSYKLWEKLSVRKIKLSRKAIQRAYKEIHECEFEGDIIDYICYRALLDFVIHAFLSYDYSKSIDKTLSYLDTHVSMYNNFYTAMYRLILKDEKYLVEAFGFHGINTEDEIFVEVRKFVIDKINSALKYKP